MVAFFLVVAVVALPLLLLPTGKPPKPPPGPPKTKKTKQKTKQNNKKSLFSSDPGFQAYGGVPGEDFDMENSILRSKNLDSGLQRPKMRKTEIGKKQYSLTFSVFGHNSKPVGRIWTRLGGN